MVPSNDTERRERVGLLKRVTLIHTIWLAMMNAVFALLLFCRSQVVSGAHAVDLGFGLVKPAE
jgi:hypothetical protein